MKIKGKDKKIKGQSITKNLLINKMKYSKGKREKIKREAKRGAKIQGKRI